MDSPNFPIEFNNEVDDVKKSDNEFYALAADRLSKIAEGHTDISGAVVNLKKPAKGRETPYIFEVTIVLYMGPKDIVATEQKEQLQAALDGALDAVERQVREYREQQRNY